MPGAADSIAAQLDRQVAHWTLAASRLKLDDLASAQAWGRLESYLGLAIRRHLSGVIEQLAAEARVLAALQQQARTQPQALPALRQRLLAFRSRYLRAETTLDFFADAINARTSPEQGALLRACDTLAHRSMSALLEPLGRTAPVSLCYIDKGLGASILKAGLRLWDGGAVCPVAVIKITRHNLLRPTALIHEAGHQVAHLTGWNAELALTLQRGLRQAGATPELAHLWASWASEIAADAFAFAHTGFAAVAALHDVLAGDEAGVFRHVEGAPHPISHLRVLLGARMCRVFHGDSGPWAALEGAWTAMHPPSRAEAAVRATVLHSLPLLEPVVRLTLCTPMQAFGGKPLRELVMPERASPAALHELDARIGPALFTSPHWLWSEPLRILGLTGLKAALAPERLAEILDQQQQAMLRLGAVQQAA